MGLVFTRAFERNQRKFNELKAIKERKYRTYVKETIEAFYNETLDFEFPCFFIDSDLDEPDDNSLNERDKIILWAKSLNRVDVGQLYIKDNLKINIHKEKLKQIIMKLLMEIIKFKNGTIMKSIIK